MIAAKNLYLIQVMKLKTTQKVLKEDHEISLEFYILLPSVNLDEMSTEYL